MKRSVGLDGWKLSCAPSARFGVFYRLLPERSLSDLLAHAARMFPPFIVVEDFGLAGLPSAPWGGLVKMTPEERREPAGSFSSHPVPAGANHKT